MAGEESEFEALSEWLGRAGLAITDDIYSQDDFGNRLRTFQGTGFGVRITRERGSWYFEALAPSGVWRSLAAWSECLDGGSVGYYAPFQDQASYLTSHLPGLRALGRRRSDLDACLAQADAELISQAAGIPMDLAARPIAKLLPPADSVQAQRDATIRLAQERLKRRRG
jgi:hypothetical protein